MNICVIVPTVDRSEDLKYLVKSIENQTLFPNEIIIVDQSNNNETENFVKEYKKTQNNFSMVYRRISERSLTRARNCGIKMISSDCEIVFFFDDDVILDKNYLSYMVSFFKKDHAKNYVALTGFILNLKTKSRFSLLYKLFILQEFGNGKFKINGIPMFPLPSESAYDVEILSGCNMVFRKSVFQEFLFDPIMKVYSYMEDVDISYRISRKYKMAYIPQAQLVHNVSQINRMKIKKSASFFIQNYHYLFNKNINKNPWTVIAFWWSILGKMFICLLMCDFLKMTGYLLGLIRIIINKQDSLYS